MRTVRLSEHGVLPHADITLALHKVLLTYPEDTEFLFEEADYFFSPHEAMMADYCLSNSDCVPLQTLAVWMKGMKRCVLNGRGARLWLAGQMQVFTLDACESVCRQGLHRQLEKAPGGRGTGGGRGRLAQSASQRPDPCRRLLRKVPGCDGGGCDLPFLRRAGMLSPVLPRPALPGGAGRPI